MNLWLLASPTLAQSVGEKTGVSSALGISPTTTDFVKEVARAREVSDEPPA